MTAPPVPSRSRWWLPLAASSCLLVILVVAIVVVAADKAGRGGTGTPGPSASAAIDHCLVGTWESTSDQQTIPVAGYGPVTVTGQGTIVRIGADGSDLQDYGSSTPYTAQPSGKQLEITVTGTVKGTIRTSGNTITFEGMSANGTVKATVDGQVVTTVPLTPGTDPVSYTCTTDTLSEHGPQFDVVLRRRSSP